MNDSMGCLKEFLLHNTKVYAVSMCIWLLCYSTSAIKVKYGYQSTKLGLLRYKEMNGHMLVPFKFEIPDKDIAWPEKTWGMKLGSAVSDIRGSVRYIDEKKDLERIGFQYNLGAAKYGIIRTALLYYKELKSDMLVPQKFVVPDRDVGWRKETWGMKLGSIVNRIRNGHSYTDKRDDLESIGFEFNLESAKYGIIRAALLNYKKLNRHMLVPQKFMVPDKDARWPEETWGMNLGTAVMSIRSGVSYITRREDLEGIGFNFDVQKFLYGYESISAALLNYKKFNGHMSVPKTFVVPDRDIEWPKETWGMKLGLTVNNIRRGYCYTDRQEAFESIGLKFKVKFGNGYELTRAALLNYKELNSDMLVPQKFVVPDRDVGWPESTWGMKLGSAVNSIRCGLSYTNKREDLESIGFNFNPQKVSNLYELNGET